MTPVILILTEDLLAVPRFQDTLRQAGFEVVIIDSPLALDAAGEPVPRETPLTEPLEGPDSGFLRHLVEHRPALIILDLTSQNLPWVRWLHILKTSAATRRIPVIAFGPHVQHELLKRAEEAGAEVVVPRGRMMSRMVGLVQEHARIVDHEALLEGCSGELSALGREGIELVQQGEYFEAHEELEHAWMEAEEWDGYLYRALLQVAVSYLHIQRGNYAGAVKMLLRVRQWLEPLPANCRGVDVKALRDHVDNLYSALERIDPSEVDSLPRSLLKPIPMLDRTS